MPTTVELPGRYVRLARRQAKKRNQSFEENGAWDNQADSWGVDPHTRNFRGVMGEIAFAEYADIAIDASTKQWSDGGVDFHVEIDGRPLTVDMKTANKEPKALMVKEGAVNADYYVLGHLEDEAVTLYGGASADRVKSGLRKESRYGHVNYTLGVDYLDELPAPSEIVEYDPSANVASQRDRPPEGTPFD